MRRGFFFSPPLTSRKLPPDRWTIQVKPPSSYPFLMLMKLLRFFFGRTKSSPFFFGWFEPFPSPNYPNSSAHERIDIPQDTNGEKETIKLLIGGLVEGIELPQHVSRLVIRLQYDSRSLPHHIPPPRELIPYNLFILQPPPSRSDHPNSGYEIIP